MSLSEKSEDLPGTASAKSGDGVAPAPAAKPRGSLIERWDALERKSTARQAPAAGNRAAPAQAPAASTAAPAPGRPAVDAAQSARPAAVAEPPAAATPATGGAPVQPASPSRGEEDDDALLQDVASDDDFGPEPSKPARAASEERHPRPVTRRSGYTQVSFNMSYGGQRAGAGASAKAADPAAPGGSTSAPSPAPTPAAQSPAETPAARTADEPKPSSDSAGEAELADVAERLETTAQAADAMQRQAADPDMDTTASTPASGQSEGSGLQPRPAPQQDAGRDSQAGATSAAHDLATTAASVEGGTVAADHQLQAAAEPAATSKPPVIPPADDDANEIRYGRSIFTGMFLLLIGLGGFVAWAALAPITSGVVASGSIKLEGERKVVQHLEGGIIEELLVAEGDPVKAGQVLVRLDGSRARAVLEVQMTDYLAQLARRSRLLSERRGLEEIAFDPEILARADDPRVAELMETERGLFEDRRASLQDQLNIFGSWAEGHKREIAGLKAQRSASEKQLVHINDELQSVQTLYEKGVVAKTRLLELKRTAAGLTGQSGALTAEISRAEQKIGEAELRAVSLQNERAQEISDALTSVENAIRRLKEQLPAQVDVVERLEVRAPSDGRVVNLRYHTVGGVINPSTPILDVVPQDARLVIEARVAPIDIDVLKPGMDAQITLSAFSQRKTPPVPGRLRQVSADRIDESSGDSYYEAMVDIDREALSALPGVELYPGMPAQVQFVGGERTPMDYLLAPLEAGLRKAWLEE